MAKGYSILSGLAIRKFNLPLKYDIAIPVPGLYDSPKFQEESNNN